MQHEEILLSQKNSSAGKSPAELKIQIRLIILDLREEIPKLSLDELLERRVHIPKEFNQCNFVQTPWGKE
jgi:hypothetical protein